VLALRKCCVVVMLARYLDVELPGENWDASAKVKEVGHDWHHCSTRLGTT